MLHIKTRVGPDRARDELSSWLPETSVEQWHHVEAAVGLVCQLDLNNVELALDLAELGVLLGPQLRALKLNMNAKLTGDLQELSKTTHMENLGLGGTQVKGDIKIFESMPKLSSLVLASTLVSGDISVFTCTPQLEALNLSSTEVSGDIKTFANTPLMSKLNVHETQVTVPVSCPKDEDGDLFYDSPEAFATLLVWIRGGEDALVQTIGAQVTWTRSNPKWPEGVIGTVLGPKGADRVLVEVRSSQFGIRVCELMRAGPRL